MAKDVDVLIKTEDKPEVDNVTRLIKTMSDSEQSKMLIFLQGVKFAEALKAQPVAEQGGRVNGKEGKTRRRGKNYFYGGLRTKIYRRDP